MFEPLANLIESAADALFMPWVVLVLLGAGLFLTVRTGFVQVRRFGEACRVAFVRRGSGRDGALTPFQAFMTGLGASIGTGNIAGVATAIVSGGPGALFWIWVYGFVATAIKFAEAVLGMTFREARGDQVLSGPMYLPQRWPAVAGPRLALRVGRRHRGADDDALHATELDGAGAGLGAGDSANRLGHRDRRADVARHHRRHQVDRQDR